MIRMNCSDNVDSLVCKDSQEDSHNQHIEILKKYEGEIFHKFGVLRIGIFGSCARGTDTPESDIDIFVEFRQGNKTFDNYMGLKYYLESLFERKVDLVTYDGLNPHIRDDVLNEVIYAS